MANLFSARMPRQFNRERIVTSWNGAGKTRHPNAKLWTWTCTLHIYKISEKRSRPKNIEVLEENTAVNLYDLGVGSGFLDVTTKAQPKKIDKPDFIKIKGFCASQGPVRKWDDIHKTGKGFFESCIWWAICV